MRLCFYNPHATSNATGDTALARMAQILGRSKKKMRKHNCKYGYLLDILKNKKTETAIVVDGADTSFSAVLDQWEWIKGNYFIHKLISVVEIYVWCLLNGINPFNQTIIFNKKKLDKKTDILFGFAYCSNMFFNEKLIDKSLISAFEGKKILHASHFYKSTKKVAENVKRTGTQYMVAEADLKKSPYFNRFFGYIEEVGILPQALRSKYQKNTSFKERKTSCLALGTLILEDQRDNTNENFIHFFKTNCLHPMRRSIFENREALEEVIDCNINFQNKQRIDVANKSKLYQKSRLYRILYDLFGMAEGSDYHKMDIVKKYNEYKMFISPEESIGLPSVNVVEGMACGCAFVGIDHPMYTDIGMVNKKNYIAYDGTLEDLKRKIQYYQKNPEELEEIAKNGHEFAKQRFSEERVVSDFIKYLTNLTDESRPMQRKLFEKPKEQKHVIASLAAR